MSKPSTRATSAPKRRTSSPSEAPSERQLLGSWQLDSLAAVGTFTELHAARPTGCPPDWPADYVVKILKTPHDDDDLAINLLRREVEVGKSVSDSHIVPILDSRLDESPRYLVMPRLNGASVNHAIAAIGRISVPQALWITRQVATALKQLHMHEWVHADVKPSNIVVSPDGHATLIDFGCSLRADESVLSWDRPVVGTLHYMAPEMVTSQARIDSRSDIYSLGVTLFEMLCGRLPFPHANQTELIKAHLHETPPDLQTVRDDIPRFVAELVSQMLAKDPLKRPQTANELIARLMDLEIETLDIRVAA